jgi:hypothetical protein
MRLWRATMIRRRAIWLTVVLALLGAGGAQAMTPFAQRSMARATAEAAKELASVVLPHAAKQVRHDPSVHRALTPQGVACTKKYVVEDHHFWRVAKNPGSVWRWMRTHRHEYSGRFGYGELKQNGKALAWYIMVFFSDQRNVTNRLLSISLKPARGGGTAIRADGIAVGEPRAHQAPCLGTGY